MMPVFVLLNFVVLRFSCPSLKLLVVFCLILDMLRYCCLFYHLRGARHLIRLLALFFSSFCFFVPFVFLSAHEMAERITKGTKKTKLRKK